MRRTQSTKILPGDCIGIAAPASFVDRKLLQSGIEKLASWGYSVYSDERVLGRCRFHAGTDLDRASVLRDLIKNPVIKGIWCARGGYGVTRILPTLEKWNIWKDWKKSNKTIFGYSDITALHLAAYKKIGLKSVHAPLIAGSKWLALPARDRKILQAIMAGEMGLGENSHSLAWNTKWLGSTPKTSLEGVVLGGNLTLVANLIGTPWLPSFSGKFLFIEDCAEAPYRLDRMITHLFNSGALAGLKGVLVGDLTADLPKQKSAATWQEVLRANFCEKGIPVLTGLPVGHGKRNEALPLGVKMQITKSGEILLREQVLP